MQDLRHRVQYFILATIYLYLNYLTYKINSEILKSSRDGARPALAYGTDYMHYYETYTLKCFVSENTISAALKLT
jgi:hypothetical protein